MARSFGLTAYRALMRRGEARVPDIGIPRPDGELLWIHAAEPANTIALMDLATRLMAVREGLNVMVSRPEGEKEPQRPANSRRHFTQVPDEHPASVNAYLDHWRPDACVWAWGGLLPNLVLATAERKIPMFLIDADSAGFDGRRDRWIPDVARRLLTEFETVLVRSSAGGRRLLQLGLARDRFEITPPLLAGGHALPCDDAAVQAFTAAIVGRTVWYANGVVPEEVQTVLKAHKQALRLSHRLLLILRPYEGQSIEKVLEQAAALDLRTASWDDGVFPDEITQLLVTTEPRDAGLFYRVATVSFMGGSLVSSGTACDPFEAAALGSAVLYGPKVGQFLQSYKRLATAGAARIVNDTGALGTAVTRLVAPDQAAVMAHAGWDVISEGAAVTDNVIDLVQNALDRRWSAR